VPSVAATVVAQLAEGGAVVETGGVVDATAESEEKLDDAEPVALDTLAALCVAAADEPQPTSATAKTTTRSRPGHRLLAASEAIPRMSFTPHMLSPWG